MINDATGGLELHDAISIRDGAYGIPWRKQGVDLEGLDLPTEDYAEYLASTVSFTMSPLYHLYDKEAFLKNLRRFYSEKNAGQEISTDLWCIQMLVVFAFGKSILAREAGPSGLTGAAYFAKAVEALPDSHRLYQEPILSIEILCMFALLMQAMDMRFAAYDYVRISFLVPRSTVELISFLDWTSYSHCSYIWTKSKIRCPENESLRIRTSIEALVECLCHRSQALEPDRSTTGSARRRHCSPYATYRFNSAQRCHTGVSCRVIFSTGTDS